MANSSLVVDSLDALWWQEKSKGSPSIVRKNHFI